MQATLFSSSKWLLLCIITLVLTNQVNAQYCDSITPTMTVDLSASPNMSWISPPIVRDGSCCGSVAPDKCLEFIITLHPSTIAVSFNIASGAVPPGALFYQVDCGPATPVGAPICLNGPGPHHLTFCKPGNNDNAFSIISYSAPIIGDDIDLNAGCTGFIYGNYYNESTISWTSVAPGPVGAYDNLLSCTSGCDTTYVTAPNSGAPAFVDYVVCGMDVGGCDPNPICDTVRVNFITPISVTTSPDQAICADAPPVVISATPSGGSGAYSYLWNTGATTSTINAGPGTYFVDVVDTSGCLIASDTTVIAALPLPAVDAGPDQVVCFGDPVTLSGSGAVSYSWNNGVVDGAAFVQAVGSVTYTLTGIDANGCQNIDQVIVTVNPLPIVDAGPNQTVCEGSAVAFAASGAVSYAWDNGIFNGAPFVPAVGNTTYTVIGTDGNGCQNSDQVSVLVNPLPIVDAGQNQTVCEGESVTLTGSGAVSYSWDNGVVNGTSFTPSVGSTTYTVIGTDANGCQNTDQVTVLVNPLPIVDAGADQAVCDGAQISLNGAGASNYLWDNGVFNSVAFTPGVGTTTYSVIGTDANGCQNSDQVNITVFALPNVIAGPDQTVCDGAAVLLNGAGAVSYTWSGGVSDGVAFVPTLGSTIYTLTGTDANGCQNTDQLSVVVNPLPNVIAGPDQVVCSDVQVVLSGSGSISYVWDNGVVNGVPFNPAVGTTIFTVQGTDVNGCQNSDQVSVTVNAVPLVNAGPDQEVCEGTPVSVQATGAIAYLWTGGITNGNPFILPVGQHQFSVQGTDNNGCQNSDQLQIVVHPNPIVDAGANQSLCKGDLVTLSATGSSNLMWSSGVQNGQPFSQGIGMMIYHVYDTLSTGCFAKDSVFVEVHPLPTVTTDDAVICEGEEVTLEGHGAQSYQWSNGVVNGVGFYPNYTDTFTVIGTSIHGCVDSALAVVLVHPLPFVDFKILKSTLTTTNPITSFDNLSSGAVSYSWNFGDGSLWSTEFEPTHTFPTHEGGTYEITLVGETEFGCRAEKVKYVYVTQDFTIYVPNTFTPDNNGVNEIFKPVMEGFDKNEFTMYIFDRWGELVFESHNMDIGWDGSYAGKFDQVQDGVFTWKIEAGLENSTDSKLFIGHVTVLK